MEHCSNAPTLFLLVDRVPGTDDFRYEIKDDKYYWAELEGFVNFGYYDFKRGGDQGGYSGMWWNITTKDGERKQVRGPWSSRSSVMNLLGFQHSMEVAVTDYEKSWNSPTGSYVGYSATIEKVKEALDKFPLDAALAVDKSKGEIHYFLVYKDKARRKPTWEVEEGIGEMVAEA